MSIRQLAVAFCVALGFSALVGWAQGQESQFAGIAVGYAESSDYSMGDSQPVNLSSGQPAADTAGVATSCQGDVGGSCDCQSDCDCGSGMCDGCWHWVAGAEGTYLAPNFHNDVQFGRGTEHILDLGWEAAPRIWLGVENCNGWGARARYWQLDAERNRFGLTLDALTTPVIADFSQQLEVYDIDCELTRRIEVGHWNLLGSFGGRFGSLDRLLMGNSLAQGPPGLSEFLSFETETNAGGITGAIEMSTPIGVGGLEAFGSLRASPLWGTTTASVNARENMNGTASSFSDTARVNTQLTIWEAQVGLQCTKQLACCQGSVFARCAFEYQSWNLSQIEEVPDPSVDLYGVAFAIGFTR